jgi:hypothetical protein
LRVKTAALKDEEEQEAWYQLEHKSPLKSFGDKAYSVSVFNHSVRADCSWSVSQKTIDGVTMLMPTAMVLSKISIAFGREDHPYAWKTDIDGSDVLFGWARVNGDLRYPIDPHKATRMADTDDVHLVRSHKIPRHRHQLTIIAITSRAAGVAEQLCCRIFVTHQRYVRQHKLLLHHKSPRPAV